MHDEPMNRTGRREALLLAGTLITAIAVTVGVGWAVFAIDPAAGLAEALKAGGLAGAAVAALYALWLNDRRRRVEEGRQAVEEERLRTDGNRISHERFARAVEMLGHDADQVRVGGVHALVGLARDTTSYTQTVVDVLCAYLRRPFFHDAYTEHGRDPDRNDLAAAGRGRLSAEEAADGSERQVRLSAQRALGDLLPAAEADGSAVDLDLTGASLEYLDLEGRKVGRLLARWATFHGITRLSGARFEGQAMFTGALFRGRVELSKVRFLGGLSLLETTMEAEAAFDDAVFSDFADLRWTEPATVCLDGVTTTDRTRVRLGAGTVLPSS